MYAVVETGGKQYKVSEGDIIYVEKLAAEENAKVILDKVLAIVTEKGIKVGSPYVKGATVEAKVIKNGKGKKITVFTYKKRKNLQRKLGHRQPYTKLEITNIFAKVEKSAAEDKPVKAEKTAEKPAAEKKAPAKKTAEKPAAEKKAPAKKTAEKPAAEKKAPAKKTAEKPAAEKKAPAKKTESEKNVK